MATARKTAAAEGAGGSPEPVDISTRRGRRTRTAFGVDATDVTAEATVTDVGETGETEETTEVEAAGSPEPDATLARESVLAGAERKLANGQTADLTDEEYEALSQKRDATAGIVSPGAQPEDGGVITVERATAEVGTDPDERDPDTEEEDGETEVLSAEDLTVARLAGSEARRAGKGQDEYPGSPSSAGFDAWQEGWRAENERLRGLKFGDGPEDLFGNVPPEDQFVYPDGVGGAAYADAEPLGTVVARLVGGHAGFAHLRDLWTNDQIAVLWKKHGGRSRGKPIYTKVRRADPLDAFWGRTRAVWILEVSADHHRTGAHTNRQVERRLFDALCRMGENDDGNPMLEDPDVREFSATIRVYGLDTPELQTLGRIIQQIPLPI